MRDRFNVFNVDALADQEVTVLADDVFLMIDQGDAPTWDKAECLLSKRIGGQRNLRSYVDSLMAGAPNPQPCASSRCASLEARPDMEYQVESDIPTNLSPFVRAYLEAAEWCGLMDEQQEAFRAAEDAPTWAPESIARAVEDCEGFQTANAADLADLDAAQAGHDFWLTRNRHGAGFWDRGLGAVGERLTANAHPYGESWVEYNPETNQLSLL